MPLDLLPKSTGVVWDNHACMPLRRGDTDFLPRLAEVKAAGVDVVSLNVGFGDQAAADHLHVLANYRRWLTERPQDYALIASAGDVTAAKASGRLGVCFDIEGMNALDGSLELVSLYYDLGVRWMLPAYNVGNAAGGGCLDAEDSGLTAFGRAVVAEMNRVGMVVCGSHAGYRTARDLIDASAAPMIFSHSNPRAVFEHPRNIPDDLITACAARGGVIGLNGVGIFLGANDIRIETFVRHIEHVLDLVGDDHVGIALDYVFDRREMDDYVAQRPDLFPVDLGAPEMRLMAPDQLRPTAAALIARGHTPSTLAKLLGGNHLRIAREVWR